MISIRLSDGRSWASEPCEINGTSGLRAAFARAWMSCPTGARALEIQVRGMPSDQWQHPLAADGQRAPIVERGVAVAWDQLAGAIDRAIEYMAEIDSIIDATGRAIDSIDRPTLRLVRDDGVA